MRRRSRKAVLASYLAAGAIVIQWGGFCTIANSVATVTVGSSGILIDPEGRLFGVVNVCGTPNLQPVDENGDPTGDVLNTGDDIMVGCPVTALPDGGG